jgi:hypothetical protein
VCDSKVASSTARLQARLQGFKLVCNTVHSFEGQVDNRDHKSDVCCRSSASLVLCRASKAICQREECKKGVNIRFSFLGVCVDEFSII